MPDSVKDHKIYCCERVTPSENLNETFIDRLKKIKLARLFTEDEIERRITLLVLFFSSHIYIHSLISKMLLIFQIAIKKSFSFFMNDTSQMITLKQSSKLISIRYWKFITSFTKYETSIHSQLVKFTKIVIDAISTISSSMNRSLSFECNKSTLNITTSFSSRCSAFESRSQFNFAFGGWLMTVLKRLLLKIIDVASSKAKTSTLFWRIFRSPWRET